MRELTGRHLTISYLLALVIIAGVTVIANQVMRAGILDQASFSAIINDSGRQRMRSQRIASLVSQHANGSPTARQDAEVTLAKFETTHAELIAAAIQSPPQGIEETLRRLYVEDELSIDRMFKDFVMSARKVIELPPGDPRIQNLLPAVLTPARNELLGKLDAVVNAYEHGSDLRINKLHQTEYVLLFVVLLTLLLEAVFIFRPMIIRILQSFKSIFENASVGIAEIDSEGRVLVSNRKLADIVSTTPESIVGQALSAIVVPEDREIDKGELEKLKQGTLAAYDVEKRFVDQHGMTKWCHMSVSALNADRAAAKSLIYVVRDITEQKKLEATRDMLVGELHHRLKNVLTIIQGVVTKTLSTARSPEDFSSALSERLQNISVAHNLLTEHDWKSLKISAIIGQSTQGVFADYAGQIEYMGTDIELSAQASIALSMIIHELITNAIKHGALKKRDGSVTISSELKAAADDGVWVRFLWQEKNGPDVTPPSREGFGTFMIERGAKFSLSGTSSVNFDTAGLIVTLEFPVTNSVPMRSWA